ncbi:MAG TPA: lipoyl domain-containing protein [Planctomycetaceae bacterium]|jgi:pyruvate/2-oxoglutarate dehydrogenase complex dihydrolipoamide acyltransferase (E2) component
MGDAHPEGSRVPVVLPDLGTAGAAVCVSAWFVEPGDDVEADEPILEVMIPGITCDVCSPAAGRIDRLISAIDARVMPGDVVAWIEPA